MTLQAEWDPVGQVVIAFLDDTDPFRPRQPTGAPATPGVTPVVLDVVSHFPDPYLAQLPQLLGIAVVRWDSATNALVREWPASNFTPDAVRTGLRAIVEQNARAVLSNTDWMVVRRMETDEPIPDDVTASRARVRAWSAERKATLATASAAQLLDFDTNVPTDSAA